jgi:hypothetical protein
MAGVEGLVDKLKPKASDFLDVPFRLLSATIVGAGSWKCADFSQAVNELKASRTKLDSKPVYKDHSMHSIDNWIGYVKATSWEAAYTSDSGLKIPAGINGILSLDAVAAPKIVRGVMNKAIYSNSVTVSFDWKPSHDFEDMWDFIDALGKPNKEGEMVCRVVTKINDYFESSLVFRGADPYAKGIEDGKLINVDESAAWATLSSDVQTSYKSDKKINLFYCVDENILSLSHENINKPTKKVDKMNEQILEALRLSLGLAEGAELTLDAVKVLRKPDTAAVELAAANAVKATILDNIVALGVVSKDTEGKEVETKVALIGEGASLALPENFTTTHKFISTEQLTALGKVVSDLNAEIVTLKADQTFVEAGKSHLTFMRTECERLYKLSVGADKSSEAVIAMIGKSDLDTIKGLITTYSKDATEQFSGHCKSCGSAEFEFRTSMGEPEKAQKVAPSRSASFDKLADIADKTSQKINTGK